MQLGLHFGHARPGDLCDGIDFFDGRDQFAVAAQVGSAGEDPHRANADVGNRIARDDLPLLTGDARRLLRSDPECREYRRQQKEKVLFHRPRKISTFANVTIFWFNEITKRNNGTEKGIVVPELGDGIGRKYGRCDGFGRSGCFRHAGDGGVDGECRDEGRRRCAATTVGAEMNVTHIKPSGLGAEIVATAVLTGVEGRKLTFNVGARDAEGMIGEGIHIRYAVDRRRFMEKVGK